MSNNNTIEFFSQAATPLTTAQIESLLMGWPMPGTPHPGPAAPSQTPYVHGVLQHLPAAATQPAAGADDIFSAAALPAQQHDKPLQTPPELAAQVLALSPKESLDQARHCIAMLMETVGDAAHNGQNQDLAGRLEACVMHLGCHRLSLADQLQGIRRLRLHGNHPPQREALIGFLELLDDKLEELAEVHPGLSAPDVQTPAELRVFLRDSLNRCLQASAAHQQLHALEFLSAMQEQARRLDADGAAWPALFQALRQLGDSLCGGTPVQPPAQAVVQALEALSGRIPQVGKPPAGTGAGVPAAPARWYEGTVISAVQDFLEALKAGGRGPGYKERVRRVSQAFNVSIPVARLLVSTVRNTNGMCDMLYALCVNITQDMPVKRLAAADHYSQALNVIIDYQHNMEGKGRPIPAPQLDDLPDMDKDAKVFVKIWVLLLWGEADIDKTRMGEDLRTIIQVLEQAGALESTGVYLAVTRLLDEDLNSPRSKRALRALNRNANRFKNFRGTNFGALDHVCLRTNPLVHSQIEDQMMNIIRRLSASQVFDKDTFQSMGYAPSYMRMRLEEMLRGKRVIRHQGGFVLNPDADRHADRTGRKRTAASPVSKVAKAADPTADAKRSRSHAAVPQTTGTPAYAGSYRKIAPRPGDTAHPVAVPAARSAAPGRADVQETLDPALAALLVGSDGQASNLAVQYAANLARTNRFFKGDAGDLHTHALLGLMSRRHRVTISVERPDQPGALPQSYAAPGGRLIRLNHQLVVGPDGEVQVAHFTFAVEGRHRGWQQTQGSGNCLYEAVLRALYDAGLTPVPYTVAELRDLTAREIESRLDDYRAWIPVATNANLRALMAGAPRRG